MDRDKQICVGRARQAHPIGQQYEAIGIARQEGMHARFLIDPCCQRLRDGQGHIFFMGAVGTRGTRIHTAMTGIDHHNDVPIVTGRRMAGHTGTHCRFGWRLHGNGVVGRELQLQQRCAGISARPYTELMLHRCTQRQHDPQCAIAP